MTTSDFSPSDEFDLPFWQVPTPASTWECVEQFRRAVQAPAATELPRLRGVLKVQVISVSWVICYDGPIPTCIEQVQQRRLRLPVKEIRKLLEAGNAVLFTNDLPVRPEQLADD